MDLFFQLPHLLLNTFFLLAGCFELVSFHLNDRLQVDVLDLQIVQSLLVLLVFLAVFLAELVNVAV